MPLVMFFIVSLICCVWRKFSAFMLAELSDMACFSIAAIMLFVWSSSCSLSFLRRPIAKAPLRSLTSKTFISPSMSSICFWICVAFFFSMSVWAVIETMVSFVCFVCFCF